MIKMKPPIRSMIKIGNFCFLFLIFALSEIAQAAKPLNHTDHFDHDNAVTFDGNDVNNGTILTNIKYFENTSLGGSTNDILFISSHNETCYFEEVSPPSNFKRVSMGLMFGIMVTIIILGNLLVISAVSTFHELQTITNMFVVSLACADLIMGLVVIPVGVPYIVNGKWLLGSFFCNFWVSIDVLSVTASIETLCAVALDRYVAITKPFSYATTMTKTRARMVIAVIWITSASIAFIPIHLDWWRADTHTARCCYENEFCCEFYTNEMYAILSSCVSFYIPLVIMIFSYVIVFKVAIRHASAIVNHKGIYRRASMPGTSLPLWNKHHRRTVFTMGYIMGTFTVCWLPFFVVNVTQAICKGCISGSVFTTLNWLGYFNSFLNPIIYCHSVQFRRAFKRIVMCSACIDGVAQTKRASLSRSFGPKRSSSSSSRAGSTIHLVTSYFLSGGSSSSSLRKTRKKASCDAMQDYSLGTEQNSPTKQSPIVSGTKFKIGSPDSPIHNNNNNEIAQHEVNGVNKTILSEPMEGDALLNETDSSLQIPSRRYSTNQCNITTRRSSLSITSDIGRQLGQHPGNEKCNRSKSVCVNISQSENMKPLIDRTTLHSSLYERSPSQHKVKTPIASIEEI